MTLFAFFGCACWPNLRPYNKRKLAFRSTQCVFLGYSPRHKGVKCLDIKTGRVYISRDVVFDENVFPFASLHPNAGSRLRNDILLLPKDTPSNTHTNGDANVHDHMPLPIVPVVTNLDQDAAEYDLSAGTHTDQEDSAENFSQNNAEMSENEDSENSETDETGTDHEQDFPAASDPELTDPGENSAHACSPRLPPRRSLSPVRARSSTPTRERHGSVARSPSPARSPVRDQPPHSGASASATTAQPTCTIMMALPRPLDLLRMAQMCILLCHRLILLQNHVLDCKKVSDSPNNLKMVLLNMVVVVLVCLPPQVNHVH